MAQRRPAARAASEARDRILDHHAALGRQLQPLPGAVEALGVGLACANVLRCDDLGEMGPESGELEDQIDLASQGARHDGKLKAIERGVLDEVRDARHQPHRGSDRSLVLGMLAGDGFAQSAASSIGRPMRSKVNRKHSRSSKPRYSR